MNPRKKPSGEHSKELDVLRRRVAELEALVAELREDEQRFRRIFDEGPLGMAMVDRDYRFTRVNARFREMLGYTEAELEGVTFPQITHPDDVEKDVKLAEHVFDGEIPFYQIEKRYLTKTGASVWASLTATVIRNESGKPLYGLAMVEDITERRRAEDALLESERVEAVEQLAVTIRHEVNNSLTTIVADAQQLVAEDSGLNEEQRAVAKRVHEAGLRIAQDIKRITELSAAPVTDYAGGVKMLDLDAARKRKR
jgi:PAS domain S-box-containing protein